MTLSYTRYSSKLLINYSDTASRTLNKDHWRVNAGFRYYIGHKNSDMWVDVPAGYLTDGASVPKALHSIVGPWGNHGHASALHDYLCEYLTVAKRTYDAQGQPIITPHRITRKTCDDIFLEAMSVSGVGKTKRYAMWLAVSAFRYVSNSRAPSLSLIKLQLERQWRQARNIPEPMFGLTM